MGVLRTFGENLNLCVIILDVSNSLLMVGRFSIYQVLFNILPVPNGPENEQDNSQTHLLK